MELVHIEESIPSLRRFDTSGVIEAKKVFSGYTFVGVVIRAKSGNFFFSPPDYFFSVGCMKKLTGEPPGRREKLSKRSLLRFLEENAVCDDNRAKVLWDYFIPQED